MPEPMTGTGSGKQGRYKVRVADVDEESNMDCSPPFYLLPSDEAPVAGDVDGPYLKVTSPTNGDMAMAGDEYTVEVRIQLSMPLSVSIVMKPESL